MTKSESGKKFALIAAICFAITAAYDIINRIIYVSNYEYATITVLNIIWWCILIGYAVTLFLKNSKTIIFVAGAEALLNAYDLISYFSLLKLLTFVASGALVAVIVLATKGHPIVKKLWFLPGAAMMLGKLIGWIQYEYFSYLSVTWKTILFGIIEVAAIVFIGMWLKKKDAPVSAAPVNEYASFNPNAVYSSYASDNTIGGADKLKMYKELLDSGTITQEEFDAKKKQILGL